MARVLERAGCRVGSYTSPHLVDLRERVVVNGVPISESAFAAWTTRLQPEIERVEASFFEAYTAIAFADFAARGVELAVVETGLGGRLDSTNVLQPIVSAITQIGMDHAEYLGNDLSKIAWEKAHVAKSGTPLIVGETDPVLVDVIRSVATQCRAVVRVVEAEAVYEGEVGIPGLHQRRNAEIAVRILQEIEPFLPHLEEHVRSGIATARLPGRMERHGKWLFDVAHNESAVKCLVREIQSTEYARPIHVVLGMLADKPARETLDLLASVTDAVWLTVPISAPPSRRWSLEELGTTVDVPCCTEVSLARAMDLASEGAGTVLVTGSFHTVGDVMARLPGLKPLG